MDGARPVERPAGQAGPQGHRVCWGVGGRTGGNEGVLQDWLWERGDCKAEIQGTELVNHHYASYGTQFSGSQPPSLRTGKKDGVRNMERETDTGKREAGGRGGGRKRDY